MKATFVSKVHVFFWCTFLAFLIFFPQNNLANAGGGGPGGTGGFTPTLGDMTEQSLNEGASAGEQAEEESADDNTHPDAKTGTQQPASYDGMNTGAHPDTQGVQQPASYDGMNTGGGGTGAGGTSAGGTNNNGGFSGSASSDSSNGNDYQDYLNNNPSSQTNKVSGTSSQKKKNSLVANPTNGDIPLTITFSATNSTGWFGGTQINPGDGSDSKQCGEPGGVSSCEIQHTYTEQGTYTAQLIGLGEGDGSILATVKINVGENDSTITLSPISGNSPLTVSLSTNNNDVNDKIAGCKYASVGWYGASGNGLTVDWGDRTIEPASSMPNITEGSSEALGSCTAAVSKHTYISGGTYTVKVTSWHPGPTDIPITDWEGTATVTVDETEENYSGIVVINYLQGPEKLEIGEAGTWKVSANSQRGVDDNTKLTYKIDWGEGNFINRVWDRVKYWFGERGFGQDTEFSHSYEKAGNYTVTVTVRDQDGNTAKKSKSVTVGNPENTNDLFDASPASGKVPLTVTFSGNTGPGCNGGAFELDYGDGSSKDLNFAADTCKHSFSTSHTYAESGKYAVALINKSNNETYGVVNVEVTSGNLITNFFGGVADFFQNMFSKAVSLFFPSLSNQLTNRQFADLPETNTTDYRPGTRTIEEIEAIIINTQTSGNSTCTEGVLPYSAYIITIDNEIGISDCATDEDVKELTNYLYSISYNLKTFHSFELISPSELEKLPIYIGDIQSDLDEIVYDETTASSMPANTIGMEVRVKDKDGTLVKDWTTDNVNILNTDELAFRWNASEYTQCLPFLADNGSFALSQGSSNPKLTTGDTEAAGFNVYERTGLYHIECYKDNDYNLIDIGSIYVVVGDERSSNPQKILSLAINPENPLEVTATRTSEEWGDCGDNYVGEIDWGDGNITKQPESDSPAVCDWTTVSETHQYGEAGVYLVTITLDGQRVLRQQISVGGQSGKLSAVPISGSAPLLVAFGFNVDEQVAINFGDESALKVIPCPNKNCDTSGTIKHIYSEPGTYTATLEQVACAADKSTQCTSTGLVLETINITVEGSSLSLTTNKTSGKAPLSVKFNALFPAGGATLTFGDGSDTMGLACIDTETCEFNDINHTYQSNGTYEAKLVTGCNVNNSNCNQAVNIDRVLIVVSDNPNDFSNCYNGSSGPSSLGPVSAYGSGGGSSGPSSLGPVSAYGSGGGSGSSIGGGSAWGSGSSDCNNSGNSNSNVFSENGQDSPRDNTYSAPGTYTNQPAYTGNNTGVSKASKSNTGTGGFNLGTAVNSFSSAVSNAIGAVTGFFGGLFDNTQSTNKSGSNTSSKNTPSPAPGGEFGPGPTGNSSGFGFGENNSQSTGGGFFGNNQENSYHGSNYGGGGGYDPTPN